jgi:hypothetical protein
MRTAEEKIDALADEIVEVVRASLNDCYHADEFDPDAARVQIRRTIRDSCSELWAESAAEVECERLKAIIAAKLHQRECPNCGHIGFYSAAVLCEQCGGALTVRLPEPATVEVANNKGTS